MIWYADYYGVPETPYQFTFWQYTDLGWVSGISETETDLNLWFVKTEKEQEEPAENAEQTESKETSKKPAENSEAAAGAETTNENAAP